MSIAMGRMLAGDSRVTVAPSTQGSPTAQLGLDQPAAEALPSCRYRELQPTAQQVAVQDTAFTTNALGRTSAAPEPKRPATAAHRSPPSSSATARHRRDDRRRRDPVPDPQRSWIDLSPFEGDEFGVPRAYVHLVASANAYCCDQAIFPTVGSANPVLTGLTLAHRLAQQVPL
jgi:hypothetical protein